LLLHFADFDYGAAPGPLWTFELPDDRLVFNFDNATGEQVFCVARNGSITQLVPIAFYSAQDLLSPGSLLGPAPLWAVQDCGRAFVLRTQNFAASTLGVILLNTTTAAASLAVNIVAQNCEGYGYVDAHALNTSINASDTSFTMLLGCDLQEAPFRSLHFITPNENASLLSITSVCSFIPGSRGPIDTVLPSSVTSPRPCVVFVNDAGASFSTDPGCEFFLLLFCGSGFLKD